MRHFTRFPIVSAALLIVMPVAARAASPQTTLSQAEMARVGIVLATLHTMRMAPSIPAIGVVLDPAPLMQLAGEIAAAESTVSEATSKVALEGKLSARAAQLYQGRLNSALEYEETRGAFDAAQLSLAAARTRRQSLLAQTAAKWGAAVTAALHSGGTPLPQVAAGKTMLLGLSLPPGASLAAPPSEIEAEAEGVRFTAQLIGLVPGMLGGFPGQAILYQAAAQPRIPIGATVSATVPTGAERTGVLVPWSAVLWRGDKALVFRAVADGRFDSVPIATDSPTAGGYFVAAPLVQGNRIVVQGAALLLGPLKPAAGGDDDEDD